jgi:hypothetical protein
MRLDKPLADLFDMQDEIVARLANALNAHRVAAEARRAEMAPNPDSMDLYFQGLAWLNKGQPLTMSRGRAAFTIAHFRSIPTMLTPQSGSMRRSASSSPRTSICHMAQPPTCPNVLSADVVRLCRHGKSAGPTPPEKGGFSWFAQTADGGAPTSSLNSESSIRSASPRWLRWRPSRIQMRHQRRRRIRTTPNG